MLFLALLAVGLTLIVAFQPPTAGSLGPWRTTTNYPDQKDSRSCVVSAGYIYCIGGLGAGEVATNAVYYGAISPSGEIQSWNISPGYPTGVWLQSCVVANGYIYCIGGFNTNAVYYAALLPSGNISSWSATTDYPFDDYSQSCIASSGYIYCVGGNLLPTNAIYYANLSPSGGIVSWNSTTSYPIAVEELSCVAPGGYIYCIGGFPAFPPKTNATYYAALSPSGGIGSWKATTEYPTPASGSCAASGEYIYCVAGGNNADFTGGIYTEVYYAQLSSSGGISSPSWKAAPNYPPLIVNPSCVAWAASVYCVGGLGGTLPSGDENLVYYAQVISPSTASSAMLDFSLALGGVIVLVAAFGALLVLRYWRGRGSQVPILGPPVQ
jgi:hypothetical protein